jgi:hypothetical protein
MVVEGAEKKKIFWSDIEVSSGDASTATSSKKQRTEGEVVTCSDFCMFYLAQVPIDDETIDVRCIHHCLTVNKIIANVTCC